MKVNRVATKKHVLTVVIRFWLTHSFLYVWLFEAIFIGKTLVTCKGDNSAT